MTKMKKYRLRYLSCFFTTLMVCTSISAQSFQAHRGGRGVMPENTIEAMKYAIGINGVTTLEMDLCVSKDKKIVVSHDVYFHSDISTTPEGKSIPKAGQQNFLLYSMTYDSICKYDVGLKPHPEFPLQKKFRAVKPLLSDLIDSCEKFARLKHRKIRYNLEIKSRTDGDGSMHPPVEEFVDLVVKILDEKKIMKRTNIQSFDVRPLQVIHRKYPKVILALLVGKNAALLDENLTKLGFVPQIYCPEYKTITSELIVNCHRRNMKIIVWTPNTKEEINTLLHSGVDGIITDFPEFFKK